MDTIGTQLGTVVPDVPERAMGVANTNLQSAIDRGAPGPAMEEPHIASVFAGSSKAVAEEGAVRVEANEQHPATPACVQATPCAPDGARASDESCGGASPPPQRNPLD